MSTISSLADLGQTLRQQVRFTSSIPTNIVGSTDVSYRECSGALGSGMGSIGNTTTGVVPVAGDPGFPSMQPFSIGCLTSVGSAVATDVSRFWLYDRLFHVGPFTWISAGATATLSGQPSFASRVPNGDYTQVMLFVESIAATTQGTCTVQVTFTDGNGAPGQTTTNMSFPSFGSGSAGTLPAEFFCQIPLPAGANGIQKVESITYSTNGGLFNNGSFNIVIARPLHQWRLDFTNVEMKYFQLDAFSMPQVYQDSAFFCGFLKDGGGTVGMTFAVELEIAGR